MAQTTVPYRSPSPQPIPSHPTRRALLGAVALAPAAALPALAAAAEVPALGPLVSALIAR
jgi:hypothetical protein